MNELFDETGLPWEEPASKRDTAQPQLIPDPSSRYEPFPLTDVQKAYWLGRSTAFDLGNIGCHVYLEASLTRTNRDVLQATWQMLVDHHEMLRAVVREDGSQQILPEVPRYVIEHTDLRGRVHGEAQAALDAIRTRMSHQVFRADRWPLFELRTSELDWTVLHLSLDLLFVDFWSIQLLLKEFMQLAADPDPYLPPLDVSFRDYVLWSGEQQRTASYQRAEAYWQKRLDVLPPAPALPLAKSPSEVMKPRFVRREAVLGSQSWRDLKMRSASSGVTPSITLLAAFSRILAARSREPRFTLNLTQFQRAPVHPQVNRLLGDFTSVLLLEVDDRPDGTFEALAKRTGAQFWSDLEHREYGGLRVLRDLAKRAGPSRQPSMPIVFTSALSRIMSGLDAAEEIGSFVYGVSQTPQVWLDHQVYEQGGRLHLTWDAVEELFPQGLLDDMFAAYCDLLRRLSCDELAWHEPSPRHIWSDAPIPIPSAATIVGGAEAAASGSAEFEKIEAALSRNPLVAHACVLREQGQTGSYLAAFVARRRAGDCGLASLGDAPWPAGPLISTETLQERRKVGPELHDFADQLEALEHRSKSAMVEALRAIDVFGAASETWTAQEIVKQGGFQPRYERLIERWLQFLVRDGLLVSGNGKYSNPWPLQPAVVSAPDESGSGDVLLTDYFASCQRRLPDLLRGALDPLDLLFPGGGWHVAEALYEHNPLSRRANEQAGAVVRELLAATTQPIRVLELGAGIGSATAALLPELPPDRADYLFTDVTQFFHPQAKQKFAAYPFVRYGVVDALRDPVAQGLVPHSFDLIVAANVMHNAEDPAAALARLRPLLASGGLILLIEATRNTRAHAVSIGFIEGLSSAADGLDRPFLSLPDWIEALKTAGFPEVATGRDPDDATTDFGIDLIAARAQPVSPAECRQNLEAAAHRLSGDALRGYLSWRLPASMLPADIMVLNALPLTADGGVNRNALPTRRQRSRPVSRGSSATEVALTEIWSAALGRDVVGPRENFFELGGDSLVALRILASVRERFHVELRAQVFFEHPRIRELAAEIERRIRETSGSETIASDLSVILPDPAHATEPFPLTEIQQAYWIGRSGILELGNVGAHFYLELETVSLDRDRLEAAWQQLIERHGMLRTVVLPDGRQRLLTPPPHYRIEIDDVAHLPHEDAERVLAEQRARMSHQVHLGERWPPYEIKMTRVSAKRMRLHVSLDLLMIDLWSFRLLMREWLTLYADPVAELGPIEISFRDYVLAVRGLEKTEAWQRSLSYWQQRITQLPPAPELPLARVPATVVTPQFKRRAETLAENVWQAIKAKAKAERLTPSSVLLAAFADVLACWSRREQLTINLTLFQRLPLHPQINRIVGDFTSITLLGVDCASSPNFADRARSLQTQLWQDLEHREVGGVRVLREMARSQGAGVRPIMPVVFTSGLAQGMPELERLERLQEQTLGEIVYSVSQTPQVWLDHQVYEQGGQLYLSWDAVEELFPPALLDDMFAAHCGLLGRLARDDAAWGDDDISLVPAAQLAQRASVNDTAGPPPTGLLHERFFEQARLRPDQTAVVSTTRCLSYREVAARAHTLARRLRQMGARPNSLVAIMMEKGWEQVVAAIAVLEAGAAYLPIDPDLPQERRWLLLDRGGVEIVLTQPCLVGQLKWPAGINCVAVDGSEPRPFHSADEPLPPAQGSGDLAYVIFTSGSTGEPKGVMIEHGAALNTVTDINERFEVGPHDRILALSSLSFDLSVYDVFGALAAGATIVMPHSTSLREPADWVSLIEREQVTIWNSVPALLEMLVDHVGEGSAQLGRSLRLALLSGDWIPLQLPDQIRARAPDLEVVSLGGATEASIWSIAHPIATVEPDWPSIPYGRPLRNQTMHVLDDAMEPCPIWVPGHLCIGGVGLARGYWRDDFRTHAQFVHHPRTRERLYRTGDFGRYLPDGTIEFLGREDDQVKVQGYRIELGEIESALERNPEVKSAAVVAVGERGAPKHLAAFVVANPAAVAELKERLRETVPGYMVPNVWRVIDEMPLTSNGKVDRKALLTLAAQAGAKPIEPRSANHLPANLVERITVLVAEELALSDLVPDQNLLTVGATSLDLFKVVTRLDKEFGVRPSFQEFFAAPTVTTLAGLVHARGDAAGGPVGADTDAPARPRRNLELIIDPAAREAFRREERGIRTFAADWGTLPLQRFWSPPELNDGAFQRRTVREFRSGAVPLAALGAWLAELSRTATGDSFKYAYGSAGSCYPVQTYLHAKSDGVAGCPTGTFYYHPIEHCLVPLTLGVELDPEIHEPFTNRPIFDQARFSVFFVNQPRAIEPMYGDLAWRFSALEAGAMAHILESSAARFGLGVCPIGMLDFAAIRPLLHLDDKQEFLHAHVGGLADTSPASDDWEEGIV